MGKDLKGKELGQGYSQRKDGRYCYRFTNRFGERKSLYDSSLTKLRVAVKEEIGKDALMMNSAASTKITLNELVDITFQEFRPNLKQDTKDNYLACYKRLIRNTPLGNTMVAKILPLDIQKTFNEISRTYSKSICTTLRAVLLNAYDVAVMNGITNYNFIRSLKSSIYAKDPKVVHPLSVEQQILFQEYCGISLFGDMLILILNTGLRAGEVFGLRISDVDLEHDVLHVQRQLKYKSTRGLYDNGKKYKFENPKYNSARDIPLNKTAKRMIENQLQLLKLLKANKLQKNNKSYTKIDEFDDLLYLTRTGTGITRAQIAGEMAKIFQAIREAGYSDFPSFGLHILRHTFATRCAELGVPCEKLKEIMGHKSIKVTMDVYVSVIPSNKDTQPLDVLNKLDESSYDILPS